MKRATRTKYPQTEVSARKVREVYPEYGEAHMMSGDERRKMLFKRCEHSPYLEKMRRGLPDTDANREHLGQLKRMRLQIFHMEIGWGSQGLGMMLHSLRNRYPEAHDAFLKEIREQLT